ncbi:hypothetical protein GCM10027568_01780 [Humibacter soli]
MLSRIIRDQRVAFLLVGGFNTAFGYAMFVLFQWLFGDSLGRFGYLVSLVCSYAVAIFVAFLLHRYLVFRVRGHFWLDLTRFTLVNLLTLGINAVVLPLVIEVTGAPPVIAQAGVALFSAVASYVAHKYFSFRRAAH